MAVVRLKELDQLVFVIRVHAFDDKAVVMGEKEEATTRPCTFSGLENCRPVAFNVQRLDNTLHGDVVDVQKLLELFLIFTFDRGMVHPLNIILLRFLFNPIVQGHPLIFIDFVVQQKRICLLLYSELCRFLLFFLSFFMLDSLKAIVSYGPECMAKVFIWLNERVCIFPIDKTYLGS